jgi:CRP/FNR family transcriptional regulator, polysaccharide utilization system transcription regulator
MKKILVIEDDHELQNDYKDVLESENFEVGQAYTGKEGVRMVSTFSPDLILLDIMLPQGLNGFDVLEIIKKNGSTQNIPVIILTNLDTEEKQARQIGAVDYIVKASSSIDQVVAKIKKYAVV